MWIETDSRRWTWSLCLVAAVVGFLIVYMAPGNEARRSHFAQAGSVDTTLRLAARHGVPTVAQCVFDVRLISATVVLLMLQSLNGSAGKVPRLSKVLIVVLTANFTTAAALLGGYWAAGIELPDRTLGGIYMGFLVGWFAIVIQAAGRLAADLRALRFSTPLARLASITLPLPCC